MKYEAILTYSSEHSVKKMCQVLGLKQAGYYQWKRRLEKRIERREKEKELALLVGNVFEETRKVYGYRKMHQELNRRGIEISEYRVRKIMRENGYIPVVLKKYKWSRKGKTDGRYFANHVNQNFHVEKENEIWVGDITYIKTAIGFVYLAVIIDLYNREVVGYSVSKEINTELVLSALGNAIARTGARGKGLIFHSDRGCQYSSKSYQSKLIEYGIKGSMSRPGCPYDNACSESFFSIAKRECIYRKGYVEIGEVKQDLFEYIELFYNRNRLHSVLDYMSPVEYRLQKKKVA